MNPEQAWEPEPTEDYWQALLEQGELPAAADANGRADWPAGPPPDTGHPGPWVARNGVGGVPRQREEVWEALRQRLHDGVAFEVPVIGCNKGGLLIRVCDNIGFVPASQLVDLPVTLGTDELRADLERMVGRLLAVRVIELDPTRNRVICSERATQWEDSDVDTRLRELQTRIGETLEGVVRSLCDFGAFVDLGGIDGLIHISELSWQRVRHTSDVLAVGEHVGVMILSVDLEGRRVGLSRKRLRPDPWALVGEHYAVGDIIDVVVTNIVPFGAFARVDEGVEGLIHISELSEGPFAQPSHVVSEGQAVRVRVLHIDADARRLGLSVRQA